MTDENRREEAIVRRYIWRHRGRRFATGLNVVVSAVLATALTIMVNAVAERHVRRWVWSWNDYYELCEKTGSLVRHLESDVDVLAFFQRSHPLYVDVRNLLKEYEYEAARMSPRRLHIEMVDPDRDLARTRALKQSLGLEDANVVVFQCGKRRRVVEARDLARHTIVLAGDHAEKKLTGFLGEQAFSSAIQSVIQAHRPTVYFLTGHGERDIGDFSQHGGYSALVRTLERDNILVKPLELERNRGVPADASALVIAGPDRQLAQPELDLLSDYLDDKGRVLLLLDPAVTTGLDSLLGKWGVRVARDIVVGLTLSGRELVVRDYGDHPVTRNLRRVTTMFYMPRSVEPEQAPDAAPASDDRPRVTVLASNTAEGWAEYDLGQSPPRFDDGVDRRGPVSVAVAVERGSVSGIEVEIRPTRMVVIGDSYFVSNGALKTGVGGNIDFFMSALNWLLEREALLAIGPKEPGELRLEMNRRQVWTAYLVMALAMPLAAVLLGAAVAYVRRRS
jgi:ABC-type uncharacterized transport system involved in gliding motility auxiliary subunit